MTKCGFCGLEFDPGEAELTCGGCPLAPGCHLIRCPRCGYEMPPESALLRRLKAWQRRPKITAEIAKPSRSRMELTGDAEKSLNPLRSRRSLR